MKHIKNMKKNKGPGGDKIRNYVWVNAGDELVEKVTGALNQIWKGDTTCLNGGNSQ